MRIAIIHELWGAGAARCALDLKRELGRRHDICYIPRGDALDTSERILEELAGFRPHVVNCHSFYGNLPYEFLATVSQKYATCFTVHDPRPIGTLQSECWSCDENRTCRHCPLLGSTWRQYLRNPYYQLRRVKRDVHNRCSDSMQIVAPSRWMKERLRAQELDRFKITHIPYGIDLGFFARAANDRAAFNLPVGKPIILFSSWYETKRAVGVRKGLADLSTAFLEYVLPSIPEAILAVAGESFAPNHPNVRPLGLVSLENLPRLLSAVDVYALPTLADNLPYSVLEAMACGVPTVATSVGGIPEQIVQGETGLLVPPGEPSKLAAAILDVLSNTERAQQMGRAARQCVVENFSMGSFVAGYERLFQEVAEDASPAI